jgi:WW domain
MTFSLKKIPEREGLLKSAENDKIGNRQKGKFKKWFNHVLRKDGTHHYPLKPDHFMDSTPPSSPIHSEETVSIKEVMSPLRVSNDEVNDHLGATMSDLTSMEQGLNSSSMIDEKMKFVERESDEQNHKPLQCIENKDVIQKEKVDPEPSESVLSTLFGIFDKTCGVVEKCSQVQSESSNVSSAATNAPGDDHYRPESNDEFTGTELEEPLQDFTLFEQTQSSGQFNSSTHESTCQDDVSIIYDDIELVFDPLDSEKKVLDQSSRDSLPSWAQIKSVAKFKLSGRSPKSGGSSLSKSLDKTQVKGAQLLADTLMKEGELVGDDDLEISSDFNNSIKEELADKANQDEYEKTVLRQKLGISAASNVKSKSIFSPEEVFGVPSSQVKAPSLSSISLMCGLESRLQPEKSPITQGKKSLWKSARDPKSGRIYYYHRITRKSTWTKPEGSEVKCSKNSKDPESNSVSNSQESNHLNGQIQKSKKKTETYSNGVLDESRVRSDENLMVQKVIPEAMKRPINTFGTKTPESSKSASGFGIQHHALPLNRENMSLRPFDENLMSDMGLDSSFLSEISADSVKLRTRTENTNTTDKTEKTHRISNTFKQIGVFESIREGVDDVLLGFRDSAAARERSGEEFSDHRTANLSVGIHGSLDSKQRTTGRTRHLRVEEFTATRLGLKAVNFEGKPVPNPKGFHRNSKPDSEKPDTSLPPGLSAETTSSDIESNYLGDNDETDVETFDDTVSALSFPDPDFSENRVELDEDQRLALDDAIKRKDWDLAASITESLKHSKIIGSESEVTPTEWSQSDIDRFISENDWDAVTKHIALMRDLSKSGSNLRYYPGSTTSKRPEYVSSSVQKRFGARSQLQRVLTDEDQSQSSWESESLLHSDSEPSESTNELIDNGNLRKQFAC